jgi:hypothetical protein
MALELLVVTLVSGLEGAAVAAPDVAAVPVKIAVRVRTVMKNRTPLRWTDKYDDVICVNLP